MSRKSIVAFVIIILNVIPDFGQSNYVDPQSGIEILFDVRTDMFPKHWYSKKIHAEAISLSKEERARAICILEKAFAKYPTNVLGDYLKQVYVLERMSFFGEPFGGAFSQSKKTIYITDDPDLKESTSFIESLFHHEVSSMLFRKHSRFLNKKAWMSVNPSGFQYGKGGIEAILNGNSSMDYDPGLNEKGFLNKYSQSALEEDIHVFSQNLFAGGQTFWSIVDNYDKIKEKTLLIIEFFNKINPEFTEEYFRNLQFLKAIGN